MDGAGIAMLSIGAVVLFLGIFIFVNLFSRGTGKADDSNASGASSDPRRGTKDGNVEIIAEAVEAVLEIATADDGGGSSGVTFGCCCGGGGAGDGGGGCGGGDGGGGGCGGGGGGG